MGLGPTIYPKLSNEVETSNNLRFGLPPTGAILKNSLDKLAAIQFHLVSRLSRATATLLRLVPRRDFLGGLIKFLAVGCGLNEGSPLANNVDDFSEIIYERSSAARRNTLTTCHWPLSTLCSYVASDMPSLMHRVQISPSRLAQGRPLESSW